MRRVLQIAERNLARVQGHDDRVIADLHGKEADSEAREDRWTGKGPCRARVVLRGEDIGANLDAIEAMPRMDAEASQCQVLAIPRLT